MSVCSRYQPLIDAVNERVSAFNRILSPEVHFPRVDPTNPGTFSDVAGVRWDDQKWPSSPSPGVYLVCGLRADLNRFIAYVGKSSRAIGSRLHYRLHPQRQEDGFSVINAQGERFPLEAILAIPVAEGAPSGLASALEEFILEHGIKGVELVNSIGNRAA